MSRGWDTNYDLYYTYAKTHSRDHALMIEKLLLSTFDFIGNKDNNYDYRHVMGCQDCILEINDFSAEEKVDDITTEFRYHLNWLWIDSGNKILPFVANIYG